MLCIGLSPYIFFHICIFSFNPNDEAREESGASVFKLMTEAQSKRTFYVSISKTRKTRVFLEHLQTEQRLMLSIIFTTNTVIVIFTTNKTTLDSFHLKL